LGPLNSARSRKNKPFHHGHAFGDVEESRIPWPFPTRFALRVGEVRGRGAYLDGNGHETDNPDEARRFTSPDEAHAFRSMCGYRDARLYQDDLDSGCIADPYARIVRMRD
jgi:hypothetical protein